MRLPGTLLLVTSLLAPAVARADSLVTLPGHVPRQVAGATLLEPVGSTETIQLNLALRLDQALLDQTVAQIYSAPPHARRFLNATQFSQTFELSAKRQALKDFAAANGLTVDLSRDDPLSLLVAVYGPAASVESAFHLHLNRYQGADGRVFRAPDADPSIPSSLTAHLGAVLGLTDVRVMHPHLRASPLSGGAVAVGPRPATLSNMHGDSGSGMAPSDIRTVYGLNPGLNGAGQTVGLVEFDGYNPSDISLYTSGFGITGATLTFESVGQSNLCGPSQNKSCATETLSKDPNMAEVALDIEMVVALSTALTQVTIYEAPNSSSGGYAIYSQMESDYAHNGVPQVVSSSWGLDQEDLGSSLMNSEGQVFESMAAQGQSVYAAAGDHGAYDYQGTNTSYDSTLMVDDPASQPYVTGVGGTSLSGSVGGTVSETVWNDTPGCTSHASCEASGGGVANLISGYWSIPSYQVGVTSAASSQYRNVPDVALNADPYSAPYVVCVAGSCSNLYGGTSAAAPLWASWTALLNQQRSLLGNATPLGQTNATLYPVALSSDYASVFNPIPSGTNNGYYSGGFGYNNATGWGSFQASALMAAINSPGQVSNTVAATQGVSSITWTWSSAVSATSYDVFNGTRTSQLLANVSTPQYMRTGLLPNTTASLWIEARNADGDGTGLQSTVGTTFAEPPTGLLITGVGSSSMTLSFSANSNPTGTQFQVSDWQAVGSTSTEVGTSLTPTLTGLAEGATYYVTVAALNSAGVLASYAGPAMSTVTIATPTSAPVVVTSTGGITSIHPPSGVISLQVPSGALTQPATITLSLPTCSLATPVSATGSLMPADICVQIDAGGVEPVGDTTLSIGYQSSNVAGLDVSELIIARFDPIDNVWVPLPSSVDTVAQTVTAETGHWSLFQVMQNAPGAQVQSALAFPNPWRVSQGPPTMTFSQLPAGAEVRIFTISGRIVKQLAADGAGLVSWDGTNESGRPVASGFYFALAQGTGGSRDAQARGPTVINRATLVFLLVLPTAPAAAQFSSSANGTTTADFLNLGVGAREMAMGGAVTAAVDDATALYWNPAALTRILGGSATLMHAPYVASSYFDYAAAAYDLGSYGAVGAGAQYFSLGGLSATDSSGVGIGTQSPYDLAASLGYAYRFNDGERGLDGLSVGVVGKVIEQKIVTSVSGYAVDIGALSAPYLDGRLRLAGTAQNLGASVKFDQQSDPLPLTLKIGAAFQATQVWLVSLDVAAPRGGSPYAAFGTDYRLVQNGPWTFALRGGYSTYTAASLGGLSGLAMGFGVGYRAGSVDYAFSPMGALGQAQRLSLTFRF